MGARSFALLSFEAYSSRYASALLRQRNCVFPPFCVIYSKLDHAEVLKKPLGRVYCMLS